MLLKEKIGKLTYEHVGMVYIDLETGELWKVIETFHCAGGLDEHQYVCKYNHWTEYNWEKVRVG